MTDELIQTVVPTVEPVAEVMAEVVPTVDSQAAVDLANFAGMVADDPEATQRYLDSLLRVMEMADDASRLIEVLPLW